MFVHRTKKKKKKISKKFNSRKDVRHGLKENTRLVGFDYREKIRFLNKTRLFEVEHDSRRGDAPTPALFNMASEKVVL